MTNEKAQISNEGWESILRLWGLPQFIMAEAGNNMIVDHTGALHQGVANGGAHKSEALLFQLLAQLVGEQGACRYLF